MLTNQKLIVQLSKGTLEIGHKTKIGLVNDVLKIGNKYRVTKDLKLYTMQELSRLKQLKEFIEITAEKQNKQIDEVFFTSGKGRNAKTYANLHILVYIASLLDMEFQYEIIDTFINNNLLDVRDDGGNDFKDLNAWISTMGDRVVGKSNQGLYIQVSIRMRTKIFDVSIINEYKQLQKEGKIPKSKNIWNSSYATIDKQELRTKYEKQLILLIQMKFVDNKISLYEAIDKLI